MNDEVRKWMLWADRQESMFLAQSIRLRRELGVTPLYSPKQDTILYVRVEELLAKHTGDNPVEH